ncbi:uncharacterized protein N7482_007051 [Penicillium canariense]|uniref:Nudix hydrolase domain-containing protein n=1 Tax=Penicillium canariense TaxID=189055 RepID=A0A9W9HYW8_9EURO|nr:uncharacterized protein N7482_007051 [Penicillium canariense]KAJ5160047.1 hypothetical protein N7482_007051 [Penicillium canariense]
MTESKMQLEDWLDDLCVRFIINLPHEELESVERICFQVEEAQWFYEDFIRPLDPALPSLSLKAFSLRIFQHCPLMSQWSHYHHMAAFSEFLAYKTRVPVRGAILLNEEMDSVVLVKGWKKGANWSFPRGKINKGEPDLDCAIREVYEETGFDVRAANLVKDEDSVKSIEVTMREQHMRLFVFPGVPCDTHFEPRTRKEISKIEWYKLSELPTLKKNKQYDEGMAVANANKFYMVAPFLHPLKKWIAHQKRLAAKDQIGMKSSLQAEGYASVDENGRRADFAAYGGGVSDLPEVNSMASMPDASSHIKQLLKISGDLPTPAEVQAPPPTQPAVVDQTKSNALLALLRTGSQDVAPQVQKETMTPPASLPSGVLATAQPPHLAPNFFPGFPQQQYHMAPSNFMQQTSVQHLPRQPLATVQRPIHAAQHHPIPTPGQPELQGSSTIPRLTQMPRPDYQGLYPQSPLPNVAPSRTAVAPFQQTGDPQFSQPTQPSQVPGAIVPPASKLPPPKLTSHSLALLGFFKDESKTPKTHHAAPVPVPAPVPIPEPVPVPGASQERKTSHQDSLLDLFKGPRGTPRSQPVELLGQPIPSASPAGRQILQRPPNQMGHDVQRGPAGSKSQTGAAHTSATVSGPLNMPQSAAIPKLATKKVVNGSNRRSNSNRREQTQVQPLSSPITILPRPQIAKRDVSTTGPHVQPVQAPSQQQVSQPAAPEPVKPFQPQILRRSEKTGYENLLMGTPKTKSLDPKPSLPGLQTHAAELAPKTNYDRRPSQTPAQKEALLSLFGKPQESPSLASAVQLDSQTINRPLNVSGLVSPLSSLQFPSSGESISRHGTPSEGEQDPSSANRVSSPSNKAFLLGYLQGVAKGGN